MRRTAWPRLLLATAAVTVGGLAVLRVAESRGATVLPIPGLVTAVLVLIAVVVLVAGWSVRQYRAGRRPGLDPLVAARTVVLATASAWTGALLAGWYLAHVLLVLGDLVFEGRRAVALSAGVATAGAVAMVVAGLLVERWCEIRRDRGDGDTGTEDGVGSTA
jgi:hypothetical protein